MKKAPKEHYLSNTKKEVALVWNFPSLLTPKTFLLAFSLGVFFALLLLFESGNIPQSAMIGSAITCAIIAYNFIKQQIFSSDRFRLALVFNAQELGTQSFFWTYTIPWSEVKKIQCNSVVAVTLPVSHFNFWIYPKNKVQRFISIPKLNANEYQKFFEILQWHTKQNNVELLVV